MNHNFLIQNQLHNNNSNSQTITKINTRNHSLCFVSFNFNFEAQFCLFSFPYDSFQLNFTFRLHGTVSPLDFQKKKTIIVFKESVKI